MRGLPTRPRIACVGQPTGGAPTGISTEAYPRLQIGTRVSSGRSPVRPPAGDGLARGAAAKCSELASPDSYSPAASIVFRLGRPDQHSPLPFHLLGAPPWTRSVTPAPVTPQTQEGAGRRPPRNPWFTSRQSARFSEASDAAGGRFPAPAVLGARADAQSQMRPAEARASLERATQGRRRCTDLLARDYLRPVQLPPMHVKIKCT